MIHSRAFGRRSGELHGALVEALESRQLLSVSLHDGLLKIVGTAHNDTIEVGLGDAASRPVPGQSGRYYEVSVNGVISEFSAAKVRKIAVYGRAGDDDINLSGNESHGQNGPVSGGAIAHPLAAAAVPAVVHGGAGNDVIVGGAGNDHLFGDSGQDFIIGWAGNDTLVGGAGNDVLGADSHDFSSHVAFGGPGDDTLGSTTGNSKLYGGRGKDEFVAVATEVKDRQSGETIVSPIFAEPG